MKCDGPAFVVDLTVSQSGSDLGLNLKHRYWIVVLLLCFDGGGRGLLSSGKETFGGVVHSS